MIRQTPPSLNRIVRVAAAGLLMCAMPILAHAQAAPTLKQLVDTHGSLVAGDVTFTNFRTPFPSGGLAFANVRSYGVGDDISVRAEVAADGSFKLVFTAIDRATGLPTPAFIDAAHSAAAPTDQAYNMSYDVVVTNPNFKLHSVDNTWGPATTSWGASAAVTYVAYSNAGAGNAPCLCIIYLDQFISSTYVTGRPPGGALLPQVESWTAVGTNDYSAYRIGNLWGLVSGNWGGIRQGQAYLDTMTMSFRLAPAAPPVGPPQLANLFGDAVMLSAPAGPGGTVVTLVSSDPTLLAAPAAVTVPEGAMYAPIPIVQGVVPAPTFAFLTGTLGGATRSASYEVWPAVWPPAGPPQPSLTIAKTGLGSVSSTDKRFACGIKCTANYVFGANVILTAQPASNSHFVGWGGACTGVTLGCTVAVNTPGMNAVAIFEPNNAGGGGGGGAATQFTLSIGRSNLGTVTSDVGGLNCGSTCSAKFAQSTAVSLTATPPPNKSFVSWGGSCSGTAPVCSLTVNANTSVQANFSK